MRYFILLFAMLSLPVVADVQSKVVKYLDEDVELTGYLYWDDAIQGKRPGILVIHEWWGLGEYPKKRAAMLAEMGYVAFAADMYGTGNVTDMPSQAEEWMQEITADVEGWQARATLGLEQLKASGMVEGDKLAAIGYCFGGASVLQMAYGNAEVKGVVSFHGGLPAAPEEVQGKIKPSILVLHGYADTFLAHEVVANFRKKLDESGADWEMNTYGGSRHGFTNPDAAKRGMEALAHNAKADQRSWARMQAFFKEIF